MASNRQIPRNLNSNSSSSSSSSSNRSNSSNGNSNSSNGNSNSSNSSIYSDEDDLVASVVLGYGELGHEPPSSPAERKAANARTRQAVGRAMPMNQLGVTLNAINAVEIDAKAILDQSSTFDELMHRANKAKREAILMQIRQRMLEIAAQAVGNQPQPDIWRMLDNMHGIRRQIAQEDPPFEPPRPRPNRARSSAAAQVPVPAQAAQVPVPAQAAPAAQVPIPAQAAAPVEPRDGKDAKVPVPVAPAEPRDGKDAKAEDSDDEWQPDPSGWESDDSDDGFNTPPPNERKILAELSLVAQVVGAMPVSVNISPNTVCAAQCAHYEQTQADPNGTMGKRMITPHARFPPSAARCQHSMHANCFEEWVQAAHQQHKREVTCPICRARWVAFDQPTTIIGPVVQSISPSSSLAALHIESPPQSQSQQSPQALPAPQPQQLHLPAP